MKNKTYVGKVNYIDKNLPLGLAIGESRPTARCTNAQIETDQCFPWVR